MRMFPALFLFFCLSIPLLAHGGAAYVEETNNSLSNNTMMIEEQEETVIRSADMIIPSKGAPACDEEALFFPEISRSMIVQVEEGELKNICLKEDQTYHIIFANKGSYNFTVLPGGVQITLDTGQYVIERK